MRTTINSRNVASIRNLHRGNVEVLKIYFVRHKGTSGATSTSKKERVSEVTSRSTKAGKDPTMIRANYDDYDEKVDSRRRHAATQFTCP